MFLVCCAVTRKRTAAGMQMNWNLFFLSLVIFSHFVCYFYDFFPHFSSLPGREECYLLARFCRISVWLIPLVWMMTGNHTPARMPCLFLFLFLEPSLPPPRHSWIRTHRCGSFIGLLIRPHRDLEMKNFPLLPGLWMRIQFDLASRAPEWKQKNT